MKGYWTCLYGGDSVKRNRFSQHLWRGDLVFMIGQLGFCVGDGVLHVRLMANKVYVR